MSQTMSEPTPLENSGAPSSTAPLSPPAGSGNDGEDKPRLGRLGPLLLQSNFGWMLGSTVSSTLLPALLESVDPAAKVALYGTLTSIGAIAGLLANIVFGALSDRTRTRWGARNPWILTGGFVASAALCAVSLTSVFGVMVVFYVIFQIGLNMLLAPLAAIMPDRVPLLRRGTASALIGLGQLLAQSLGAVIGAAFLSNIRAGLGIFPWVIFLTAIIFVIFSKETNNKDVERTPFSMKELLLTFRVPLDRDYLFALFGRLVLLLAFYCFILYEYYVLQDYIKLDKGSIAGTIALAGTVMAVASVIGTVVSGPIADLIKRRKPLVVAASFIIAAAFIPLVAAPSVTTFILFIAVGGFAYGIYISVDQALMSDVLPDDAHHGKDMGILNVANTAPQFLAPGLVAVVLGMGIGYHGLFTVAAVLAAIAGVLILFIRRAR